MKYIKQVEDSLHLKTFVERELEELGIKLPKKKNRTRNNSLELTRNIFGSHLCLLPQIEVDRFGSVPKFLCDAVQVLERHASTEGLFRKSGSLARQKDLKLCVEQGASLEDANPLDLAALVKQFFRELPDPLLTARHHDTFLLAYSLEDNGIRESAILLLCLLLPTHHLSTLRFFMQFLRRLATKESENKMGVQNLAVCLAPNLLHANTTKSEKMNATESRVLQLQTNIIQMLIESADKIGMVSDSLVEHCHAMATFFPEENGGCVGGGGSEHCADGNHVINDSRGGGGSSKKAKKKRSGSFQGMIRDALSTSFSKWGRRHNASSVSERSTYSTCSYTSFMERSSVVGGDHAGDITGGGVVACGGDGDVCDFNDVMTPKVRKRKADDDTVPFSATKKQAILKNMPAMSTLGGTPFTPAMRRGARIPQRGPGGAADSSAIRLSMADLSKVKKSPLKPGCFSPKTPKNGVGKTVRGFFKRLSGGNVQTSTVTSGDDREPLHAIHAAALQRGARHNASLRRRSSVFKRRHHKKTPSSPARLVSPLLLGAASNESLMTMSASAAPSLETTPIDAAAADFYRRRNAAYRLSQDLEEESLPTPVAATPVTSRRKTSSAAHRRRFSEGAGHLRRGKPNTVRTGLPLEYKRRSVDSHLLPGRAATAGTGSDRSHATSAAVSTLDTSPILRPEDEPRSMSMYAATGRGAPMMTSHVDVSADEDMMMMRHRDDTSRRVMDVRDDDATYGNDDVMMMMSRQTSSASVGSLALADQTNMESDHDRAFISSESLLEESTLDVHDDDDDVGRRRGDDDADAVRRHLLYKPSSTNLLYTAEATHDIPETAVQRAMSPMLEATSSGDGNRQSHLRLDRSAYTDSASDVTACALVRNAQPKVKVSKSASKVKVTEYASERRHDRAASSTWLAGKNSATTLSSCSMASTERCQSVDSAIAEEAYASGASGELGHAHGGSRGSMNSVDSGLSLGERRKNGSSSSSLRQRLSPNVTDLDTNNQLACVLAGQSTDDRDTHEAGDDQMSSDEMDHSCPTHSDAHGDDESVAFGRQASIRISKNMHQMLRRAGVVEASRHPSGSPSPVVASVSRRPSGSPSPVVASVSRRPSRTPTPPEAQRLTTRPPLSSRPPTPGGAAAAASGVSFEHAHRTPPSRSSGSATSDADYKQLSERRQSPYRFHNSYLRRRGSPVRIPTIFAKADEEANRYRETVVKHVSASLRRSSSPPLVRHVTASPAKRRPGSPQKASLPISSNNLSVMLKAHAQADVVLDHVEMQDSTTAAAAATENIENLPMTPKIKPGLLPNNRLLKRMQLHYDASDVRASSLSRTPIKPTKRLQGASPSGHLQRQRSPMKQFSMKEKR